MLAFAMIAALAGAPASGAVPPTALEAAAELLALQDERRFEEVALRRLARHPEAKVRERAARVVGGLAHPAAVAILAELATDGVPAVRAAAAEGTGRLLADLGAEGKAGKGAGAILRRLLGDASPMVRRSAAWGLSAGGGKDVHRRLLEHLAREGDPTVRASCLSELWRGGGSRWVATATAALADPVAEVRFAAAWSLARGPEGVETGLARAAESPDGAVRALAMEGVRRRAARELLPAALSAMGDDDARVRVAALGAVAAISEQHADTVLPPPASAQVAALVALADPERVEERVMAIRLAGVARLAREELEQCLESGEGWVAEEALVALARLSTLAALATRRHHGAVQATSMPLPRFVAYWLALRAALRREPGLTWIGSALGAGTEDVSQRVAECLGIPSGSAPAVSRWEHLRHLPLV